PLDHPIHPRGFGFNEVHIQERLGRDPLIADIASGIDQERPVEGLILEVIEGPIGLEDFQAGIGQERQRERDSLGALLGSLGGFAAVSAQRDNLGVELLEAVDLFAEDLKLLHAVSALPAQEEQDDNVLASIVGKTSSSSGGIGDSE